ncbi:MAG: hypothetical protein ACK4L7_08265 [Flavobacteriales bacterium]
MIVLPLALLLIAWALSVIKSRARMSRAEWKRSPRQAPRRKAKRTSSPCSACPRLSQTAMPRRRSRPSDGARRAPSTSAMTAPARMASAGSSCPMDRSARARPKLKRSSCNTRACGVRSRSSRRRPCAGALSATANPQASSESGRQQAIHASAGAQRSANALPSPSPPRLRRCSPYGSPARRCMPTMAGRPSSASSASMRAMKRGGMDCSGHRAVWLRFVCHRVRTGSAASGSASSQAHRRRRASASAAKATLRTPSSSACSAARSSA